MDSSSQIIGVSFVVLAILVAFAVPIGLKLFLKTRKKTRLVAACNQVRSDNYAEALRLADGSWNVPFALRDGERVIYHDQATILCEGDLEEMPTLSSLKHGRSTTSTISGGAGGAIVGGILGGPIGSVAGYALSKKTTVTKSPIMYRRILADPGKLTITNQRIVFIGEISMIIDAPLNEVLQVTAVETRGADMQLIPPYQPGRTYGQNEVRFRRQGALPGEKFIVRNFALLLMTINRQGFFELPAPIAPAGQSD